MRDLSSETRNQIVGWLGELLEQNPAPPSELSAISKQKNGVRNLLYLMLQSLEGKIEQNQIPKQFVDDNLGYLEANLATKIDGILSERKKLIETALDASLSNGNLGLRKDAYDLLRSLGDIEAIREIIHTLEERNAERKKKTLPEPVDQFLSYARGKALSLGINWSSKNQTQMDGLNTEVKQELARAVIARPRVDPSVSEQDTQKMPIITSLQVFQEMCSKVPYGRLKRLLRESNSLNDYTDINKFIEELNPQQAIDEINKLVLLLNARLKSKNEFILSMTLQDLDLFAQSGVDISPAVNELLDIANNSKDYFYRKKTLSALSWQAKNGKEIPEELLVLATEIYTNIEDLGDCPHFAQEILKAKLKPEELEEVKGIREAKFAELREPTEELGAPKKEIVPEDSSTVPEDKFLLPWERRSGKRLKVTSVPQPPTPEQRDEFPDWPDAPKDKFDAMLQRHVAAEKAARELQKEKERRIPIQEKMIAKLSGMKLRELESEVITNQYEEVCISAVGRISSIKSLERISKNSRFDSVKEIAKSRITLLNENKTMERARRLGTVSKIVLAGCLAVMALTFSSDTIRRMFSGETVSGNPETVKVIFVEKAPVQASSVPELGVKVGQDVAKVASAVQEPKKEVKEPVESRPVVKPVPKAEKPKSEVEQKKEVKEPPKIESRPPEVAQADVPLETLDDVLSYESAAPFQDIPNKLIQVDQEPEQPEKVEVAQVQPEEAEAVQVQPELAPTINPKVDSQPNPPVESQDTGDKVAAENARVLNMQRIVEHAVKSGDYNQLNNLLHFKTSEGHAGRWVKWQDQPNRDDYSVTAVQLLLRNLGYTEFGNHVEVTGQYDKATERAVRDLQKKIERAGVPIKYDGDGKFGKETWKSLTEYLRTQNSTARAMMNDYKDFKGKFASGVKSGDGTELKRIA